MPCGQKHQNINNLVTNSVKSLKMVHIKKILFKKVLVMIKQGSNTGFSLEDFL